MKYVILNLNVKKNSTSNDINQFRKIENILLFILKG